MILFDEDIPAGLRNVAEAVRRGERPKETVRTFLSWFGVYKRGYKKVREIRRSLRRLRITTVPDFDATYIDGEVEFRPVDVPAETPLSPESGGNTPVAFSAIREAAPDDALPAEQLYDPVPRLGQLEAANRAPTIAGPSDPLSVAMTKMIANDFSQLPVMENERVVKGYVSWTTIGTAHTLGRSCTSVSDCTEKEAPIMSVDKPLFEAVGMIAEKGFVFVRGQDQTITGVVTTTDISMQFHRLSEPFMLIAQIEGHLRRMLARSVPRERILDARDPADSGRVVESVTDLTFGEYVRLLEDPSVWSLLRTNIDRSVVIERLKDVRDLRNEIVHFRPDPLDEEDLLHLRETARLLSLMV